MIRPWPIPPAEVSRFAAQEYERRQRLASDAVRARKTTFDKAQLALRPWMAIAALAGAEFDELTDLLAEHRTRHVYRPAATPRPASERQARRHGDAGDISPGAPSAAGGRPKGFWRDEPQDDREVRIALAEALCPGAEWRTELERATDAALGKAFDDATFERAGKFLALARALHVPFASSPKKEPA